MGGECLVTPADDDLEPIVSIQAEYRDPGQPAYMLCECIRSSNMKQEYRLDDGRRDIYIERFTLGDLLDGKVSRKYFSNIRITEGWSSCYVYACVAQDSRSVELETSGLADLLLDVRDSRLQFNEQIVYDWGVDSWHLYRLFMQTCANCELSYAQWEQYRCCIAFRTQDLAYPDIGEGRKKMGNINLGVDVKLSKAWENIIERYAMEPTCLGRSNADVASAASIDMSSPDEIIKFLRKLTFELRLVLEYTNYSVTLDSNGGVKRDRHYYPSVGPSGLDRKQPLTLHATGVGGMRSKGYHMRPYQS